MFKQAIAEGGQVRGIAVPGGESFSRKQIDELTELVKTYGSKGLVSFALTGEGGLETLTAEDVRSPVARFFTPEQVRAIAERTGAKRGDLMLFVAGPRTHRQRQPGRAAT